MITSTASGLVKLIAPLAPLWYMFSCAVDVIIILHYLTLSHSGTCSPVQLMSSLSYLHSSAHYHQCHNYLNNINYHHSGRHFPTQLSKALS